PYFGLPATPGETIQAEDFDHGGQGYAYNDTTAGNANRGYRPNQGVDIATSSDTGGGFGVGNVVAGEWLRYTVNVLRSGTYSLGFRIANGQSSAGTFHLEADGTDLTGPISVAPTGGWQTWTTLTKSNVLLSAGTKVLRLVMDAVGSAGAVANFNWLKLTLDAATPDPVPAAPTALAAAAASATLVNLAWRDNATNESGYVVERRTGTGGAWQQIATLAANSTSYADAAVAPATAYTYRVRATTTAGENSANSNESAVTTPALPATTYLSDLAWVSATNGWGPVERDTSVGGSGAGDGGTLTLNGVTYAKGLGTHAPSEIIYNLSGNYRGFLADVGIDDRQTTQGSVVFQVYADDVLVYDSGIMRPTTPTRAVSLDVTGVRQLRLLVGDAGDGIGHDHADWANARLTTASVDNALVAPTNVAATALAPTQVRVLWTDNSTAETGYKVERSLDSGKTWTQIATAAANSSSYFDTTARAGLSYGYRVRATTGSADSAYSEATYIVTPAAVSLVTYVSDLQWESATNGWGPVERDMGNGGSGAGDGPAITLNGVVYD
ncbi:MAG TPA: NPCBM/NEW2 domain-containing protein, partial [Tepidisphaeraceae bacterium]|nr:NPCBM/NEW2 domain-containing protein [Tepidisphaeraceae bacterium]